MAQNPPPKDPSINVSCSHVLSAKHFLIWRIIVSAYFCTVFIWSLFQYGVITLISLTIQTLIICTTYILLSTYVTYIHFKYIHQNANDDASAAHTQCSRYCSYAEKAQSIAISISLTVVIAFWALLWQYIPLNDPVNYQVHSNMISNSYNINTTRCMVQQ